MEKNRQAYPLKGKRIVITRALEQAREFARKISERKAIPVFFPTITFVPEPVSGLTQHMLDSYHLVIFTSANGVKFFMEALEKSGLRFPSKAQVVAIGPATAERLKQYGIEVDIMPQQFIAEGILEVLNEVSGKRVLIPRAKVAREVLPDELRRRGAEVDVLVVYRTTLPKMEEESIGDLFNSDIITFTSPSTVENFVKMLGQKAVDLCLGKLVASIGPVTTKRALELGLKVDVTSSVHSIDGLLDSISSYLSSS